MKKSDYVIYKSKERGRVKSLCSDPNYVFVVYNCNDNWDNYEDFTASRTHVNNLELINKEEFYGR